MMNPNEEPERKTPFPGPHGRKRKEQYKFTPAELKVLQECNRESFFQRCVPFSAVLGAATYYAIKTGSLKPSQRFGVFPKITVAVVLGFFTGKLSYQQKCAEKFMALPDSKIGNLIRARKAGFYDDKDPSSVPSIPLGPFSGITDSYSDITSPNGSYDYDSRPPTQDGLDDSFRPSVDNPIILQEEEMPPEQKHITTYDELRKKNREDYKQMRLAVYKETRIPMSSGHKPSPSPQDSELNTETENKTPTRPLGGKNQYGDTWG